MSITVPVKSSVASRTASMVQQAVLAQQQKQSFIVDPLMKLSEIMPMIGNPSYLTVRRWIREGALRVHRATPHSHFRVRLSEVERFRAAGEVPNGTR